MPMVIRNAIPEDEPSVVFLWRVCDLVANYNDPGVDFRFALSRASSTVLVADDEGRMTGSVMVGHDGHRGWLYYVAAAPEARGRGVGRTLVDAGEEWLRQRQVAKVQLMVRKTNTAVVSIYERLGYENMPRVLMIKWLSQTETGATETNQMPIANDGFEARK